MDSLKESNFFFQPPIFDKSKYVACATSMFPGANSAKPNCENISDISDNEDKYDVKTMALFAKTFKRSFNTKPSVGLATKLKQCEKEKNDALYELDLLKRKNINLESDMHNIFETNKLLELKVAKLQVELDKANATFKKLNAGSQVLNEVLSSQKVSSDRGGLGYKINGSSKSKAGGKMIFVKPNSSAPTTPVANEVGSSIKENNVKYAHTKPPKVRTQCVTVENTTKRSEVNFSKFVPTCHHCGVQGHIKPQCRKLHASRTSNIHVSHAHDNAKFIPTCHYCQVKGHTRPHCRKLHATNTTHTHLVYYRDYMKSIPICHFCGVKGHTRHNCIKLYENPNASFQYYSVKNYGSRTQKPRYRVSPHGKNLKVNPNYLRKNVEKIDKVKTRLIWVRKSDLKHRVDIYTNPLDDTRSSGVVDLAF